MAPVLDCSPRFGDPNALGVIQVWDMRKPSTFERRFTAHEGLVMTICWHPEERSIIASGGRDRLIKVSQWSLFLPPLSSKGQIQSMGNTTNRLLRSSL